LDRKGVPPGLRKLPFQLHEVKGFALAATSRAGISSEFKPIGDAMRRRVCRVGSVKALKLFPYCLIDEVNARDAGASLRKIPFWKSRNAISVRAWRLR
jgi:hypothetical protein